ncbi:MAG: PIG-L family deacetylase, partial [Clostridia bacterium]
AALYLFEKSSAEVKEKQEEIILGLKGILEEYQGLDALYIHSIFDSHKTHVAASICAIEAVRLLENSKKPKKIYGCELWRDLDWLPNDEKVVFDVSGNDELSRNLMDCFASQNAVKRYDLASIARRVSNATYYASHSGDTANELIYAVDLTELGFEGVSIASFAQAKLKKFAREVLNNF